MKRLLLVALLLPLLALALPCLADDEDDDFVNGVSSSSGVSFKISEDMYLTDEGLVYKAGRGTWVGQDGVYTQIGKDWITPRGYVTENGGDYFGGGGSAIKIGNDYVRFNEDGDSSYDFTAK